MALSEMLYWVAESEMCRDTDRLNQYMALLKQKEDDPGSISTIELVKQGRILGGPKFNIVSWIIRTYRRFLWIRDFLKLNPDYFVLKYDDFISDNLNELEKYLDFPLLGDSTPVGFGEIVIRTKKSGDWKNWFLQEDIHFYRPILREFLDDFGFSTEWDLNENPVVDPAYCTKYIEKTLIKRNCTALLQG